MNVEKVSPRLLVIDDDTSLGDTLTHHFTTEGYEVQSALTGQDGLERARTWRPHVILLAVRLVDMAGLDVFQELRGTSRTAHIPVMFLAGRGDALQQNKILEAGAYDFLEKPLDLDILALRVRNALRRAERDGRSEPRTGLPTGRLIRDRLDALDHESDWYRIDVTIIGFDVFRDLYGFVTANEALRFAGNLIAQIVDKHGAPTDFVGHYTGTEDFVVVTQIAHGPRLHALLAERIGQELASFYNFEERDRGYVLVEDSAGGYVQKPLMAARVRAVQSAPDPVAQSSGEAGADGDVQVNSAASENDESGDDPFDW